MVFVDSYAKLLYWKLLLKITCQYYVVLWFWSKAHLELTHIYYSADTRLSFSSSPFHFPTGEPGNEVNKKSAID